ncbi:hypothetical protein SELMODRAFT_156751 [Selaginella moellendorffii]|uniref:Trehalase n=1 Tax=Selaginella moellendorffii TaxID=88036 RepID=D8SMS9_SELML|nr:hypothetical protein SELMODRAFT_156751 [Selaginella moellendorffii]
MAKTVSAMAMALRALDLFALLLLLLLPGSISGASINDTTPLESFLTSVQSTAFQVLGNENGTFDPKYYVDLPLKQDLEVTKSAFVNLSRSNIDKGKFNEFVSEHFNVPGTDLGDYNLSDFANTPERFLPKVKDASAREFALKIHSLWKVLAKKIKREVVEKPQRHTLFPLPNVVVIPGSRFREVYYWDTYWIIRGLLVSKLYETATSVVGNLIYLVNTYGFVPNGARSYYLNRSQPPLLSESVKAVYAETKNKSLIEEAFPALLKEHSFWSSYRFTVHIRDGHGVKHVLTRYNANLYSPRPESYIVDTDTAKNLGSSQEISKLYHQIATAAESGWDFSSRWMANRLNRTTLVTAYILPVDLNSFLLQASSSMENNIAYFAKLLGKKELQRRFHKHATSRKAAINAVFWNEEMGQYLDYWLVKRNATDIEFKQQKIYSFDKQNQNTDVFPSNFFPLWCGVVRPGDEKVSKLVSSFKKSGLLLAAGVVTSLRETGEQWDYPNAWPNLQHIIIEGFAGARSVEGLALAEDISQRWLKSSYAEFQRVGKMLEKLDARYCGRSGLGGEYNPPTGFGWSNGVVLSLFEKFGWSTKSKLTC